MIRRIKQRRRPRSTVNSALHALARITALAWWPLACALGDSGKASLLNQRVVEGRLSGLKGAYPCRKSQVGASSGLCDAALQVGNEPELASALAVVVAGTRGDTSAAARWTAALVDLRSAGAGADFVLRAERILTEASVRAPGEAGLWNDLSVARLAAGTRSADIAHLLAALEAVERSLLIDSTHAAARFNRALILERLHLRQTAVDAWGRVLQTETDEGWRAEAAEHRASIRGASATVDWKSSSLPTLRTQESLAVPVLVTRSPQAAREYTLQLFGELGRATARSNVAESQSLFARVERIAQELAAVGGDRGALLTLEALRDTVRRRKAAGALSELPAALDLHSSAAYDDAAIALTRIGDELRRQGIPLWRWATFYAGSAEMNRSRYDVGDQLYRRSLSAVTSAEPALEGKAIWALGVSELRRGNYDAAVARYREAIPLIERAHEAENRGALSYLLTEALSFSGQHAQAMREAMDGLKRLSQYPSSPYLNNHLTNVSALARQLKLEAAARTIDDEVVSTARRVRRPQVVAWALRNRARDALSLGDTVGARRDLDEGERVAAGMKSGVGRDRVLADIAFVRSRTFSRQRADSASLVITAVVEAYRRLSLQNHLPRALLAAAETRLSLGDSVGAEQHLDEAIARIETQAGRFESNDVRTAFAEAADGAYDAMVRLLVSRRRFPEALRYLTRAQLASWSSAAHEMEREVPMDLSRLLRADERVVSFAVLDDRVVASIGTRATAWSFTELPLTRAELAAHTSSMEQGLRMHRSAVRGSEIALYDRLLRPLEPLLPAGGRLTIVADRELSRIPFAALFDTTHKRYVVEQYEVRYLPSVAFLRRQARHARLPSALVIGAPDADGLPHLAHVAEEAQTIARGYGNAKLLVDTPFVASLTASMLEGHTVIHFAGHAVANVEEPEYSYLALGAGSRSVILRAREIATLRLSKLDVVVLSACSTQGRALRRNAMTSGLAYSFLLAGAGATVSTLWPVEDASSKSLSIALHEQLRRGQGASAALREAQLRMLRSPDERVASPASWAAFVVTGQ